MSIVKIIVEVHCITLDSINESRYRLYADNDLLVERTWRWGEITIIEEEIWLNLPLGVSHTLYLNTVSMNSSTKFILKNFSIYDSPYCITDSDDYSITFFL